MKIGALFVLALLSTSSANADIPVDYKLYRSLTLNVRQSESFRVPMPAGHDLPFQYQLQFAAPAYAQPLSADFHTDTTGSIFVRTFWDRVFLKDGSALAIGSDQVPLTCVYIEGQDNRYSGKTSPLTPDLFLKVYLVTNDYTCTGPVNPGWPANGAKKDTWDTYLYFEIRDPTIMLPTEVRIRYRWNEFQAVTTDGGPHS